MWEAIKKLFGGQQAAAPVAQPQPKKGFNPLDLVFGLIGGLFNLVKPLLLPLLMIGGLLFAFNDGFREKIGGFFNGIGEKIGSILQPKAKETTPKPKAKENPKNYQPTSNQSQSNTPQLTKAIDEAQQTLENKPGYVTMANTSEENPTPTPASTPEMRGEESQPQVAPGGTR